MKSLPLLRVFQVIIVLVQLSALLFVSDLCTSFESAQVKNGCLTDQNVNPWSFHQFLGLLPEVNESKSEELPILKPDEQLQSISTVEQAHGNGKLDNKLSLKKDTDVGDKAKEKEKMMEKLFGRLKRDAEKKLIENKTEQTTQLQPLAVQRSCFPFSMSNVTNLFGNKEWTSVDYVVFFDMLFALAATFDLIFALFYMVDAKQVYRNGTSNYSAKVSIIELIGLSLQIVGHVYAYTIWDEMWSHEAFVPNYPIGFYVSFFGAVFCLLLIVFDVFITDIRVHFLQRQESEGELNLSNGARSDYFSVVQ
ncbi:hypothetical protein M3Y94_00811800 [Aphelenchoides besseyi]|nr:hypothetical protein M3Y94_00811800 [Aphelenchoides besseyi]KAI6227200.1 hypothetical protein M3Y95_00701600 [Aphelenchoides besseyi]